jgi:peptidoglycan/LPS O-acetylase OafA/YrhL
VHASSSTSGLKPTPNGSTGTVENIQALRGIAALLVLYAHVRVMMDYYCPHLPWRHGGGIGVDLFFTISGFVICLTASKRHHSAAGFFLARVARVVPLYVTLTIGYFLFHVIFPAANSIHSTFQTLWNSLFFLPVFDWSSYTPPIIFVGWSLSFEMWFYLMFALCLLFCRPVLAASLLPLIIAIGTLCGIGYHDNWYMPRFMTHPYALEFAFGCVIYRLRDQIKGPWPAFLLGSAALYLALFFRGSSLYGIPQFDANTHLAWMRVLFLGLPAALIVAGMVGLELTRTFVMPSPLVWLGAISYSLYLSHWITIQVFIRLIARLKIHSPWILGTVVPVTCLIVAALCYYYVELPLTSQAQRLARRLIGPPRGENRAPEVPAMPLPAEVTVQASNKGRSLRVH